MKRYRAARIAVSGPEVSDKSPVSPPPPIPPPPGLVDAKELTDERTSKTFDLTGDPLVLAQYRLSADRMNTHRPEDLEAMNDSQLRAEKSAVKKELRAFDRAFAKQMHREPTKADKEPLRTLYERYKKLKQKLETSARASTSPSSHGPPHPTFNPGTPINHHGSSSSLAAPTAEGGGSAHDPVRGPRRSASSSPATGAPLPGLNHEPGMTNGVSTGDAHQRQPPSGPSSVLEDPVYKSLKAEKKVLQAELHAYQAAFEREHNRKVKYAEDKMPIKRQYLRYKEIKAQLAKLESQYSGDPSSS